MAALISLQRGAVEIGNRGSAWQDAQSAIGRESMQVSNVHDTEEWWRILQALSI